MPVGRPATALGAHGCSGLEQLLLARAVAEDVHLPVGVLDRPVGGDDHRGVVQAAVFVDLDNAAQVDADAEIAGSVPDRADGRPVSVSAPSAYSSKEK
jgi:hypothetical protein